MPSRDWGIQSMTSLLCVELFGNLTASAPPLLWFCLGQIKKAQMEHRTWWWAGSPKLSLRRPSACGRLVRSTLVRAKHCPIHPALKAYSGFCNDCVTREKPLFLTQTLSLCNCFGHSCHVAVLMQYQDHSQLAMRGNCCSSLSLMKRDALRARRRDNFGLEHNTLGG